jgi:predicted nucleic acid-binding protein
MILVDTSVIMDIFTRDPDWFAWSSEQIGEWAERGPLFYNHIIFAELSVQVSAQGELENRLSQFSLLALSNGAAYQAGKAFGKYRGQSGKKHRPLPDFFIGAHASAAQLPLLTRDPRRVRTFFPSVHLVVPD